MARPNAAPVEREAGADRQPRDGPEPAIQCTESPTTWSTIAVSAAEPGGGLGDAVEHHLEIGRGRRDDAQDVGGGGLLLQRT